MKIFRYTGFKPSGEKTSGVISHDGNENSAAKYLRDKKEIYGTEIKQGESAKNTSKAELDERMFMCGALGMMLSSGVPRLQALNATKGLATIPKNGDIIEQIYHDVQEGFSIVTSIGGKIPLYELMVINIGDETGQLPEALGLLSKFKAGDLPMENLELTTILVLSLMIEMGSPVKTCFEALMDLYQHDEFVFQILDRIHGKFTSGKSFSESLKEEGTFSTVSLAMIQAGELGGILDLSLPRLQNFLSLQYFGE